MGKTITGVNDLQTMNPELAGEWNHEKNGDITPSDVAVNSNKKYWWKCGKGHEWEANVNSRNRGVGCPVCANKVIVEGYNDLKSLNPELG